MKNNQPTKTLCHLLIVIIVGLIPLTGHAAMIMDADDFEHDAVGFQPFKTTFINPTATTGSAFVTVVDQATNAAGTGNGVHLFDNKTDTGLQLEYDFTIISDTPPNDDPALDTAARLSAVRVDILFAPLNNTGAGSNYLSLTLGEHLVNQSGSSTHFLDCRLLDNGAIEFLSTTGPDSTGHTLLAANNTLSIFANDHDVAIDYIGPDDVSYSLPTDSVAYWLNGNRIAFGGQGYTKLEDRSTGNGTVFNSTNNLGRFAIVSTAGSSGLNYVFDDIMISDLDSEQNPTGTSSLVSNSLAGLAYTEYANQGQTNAVNVVPDYSGAGYRGGGVPIPFVPAVVTISDDGPADDTARIQTAIDQVSNMSLRTLTNGTLVLVGDEQEGDENVFRGAVVLGPGDYTVNDTLNINKSGVVIRGAGSQENGGTRITFNSTAPAANKIDMFLVSGTGSPAEVANSHTMISDAYVPVGAKTFTVDNASGYAPGDTIIIQMLVNQKWIDDLDMAKWGWATSYYQDIKYRRIVTAVNGNEITIDAPVLQTIESQYEGAQVYKYSYSGSLHNIGFEGLRLESAYADETDEDHGWDAIHIKRLENGWVRQVTARYFVYALVNITDYCRRITVEDCANFDAVCTSASGRRYSFTVDESDSILWQRCLTRGGRHDFASGSKVQGPNVFVDCRATETYNDIGPHHRYSTGQLYDNIFGGEMNVQNRAGSGSGHGWSGAQIMFWNCDASSIVCDAPNGAMNWTVGSSVGYQAGFPLAYQADSWRTPNEPFGIWDSTNQAVTPRSLYYAQLADRLGANALNPIILPQQKAGNIWAELLLWDGDGLLLDDVVAWADEETTPKANVPLTIAGAIRNLQMLEHGNFTYAWTKVSGPGSVSFADNTALETTATFDQIGSYVLNLLVDDGTVQAAVDITVDVFDAASIPAAPTNLIATAGDSSVSLIWNDNGEPDLERYAVYRSETSGSGYTIVDANISLNKYVDNNADNNTTYHYIVTAIDSDGDESNSSNEASATPQFDTTPPAIPTGLTAVTGDGSVSLDWDNNTEPDFVGYAVYRSENPTSGYTPVNTGVTLNISEYMDTGVINDTTYYYFVTALDSRGNESLQSAGVSATLQALQEPVSLFSISFGTNNDGLGGFTQSAVNPNQETWSVEADSVRYINDDPDGIVDSGVDGNTENGSLLQEFVLDRSVGKSYIIEGVIELTNGYADDNNRIGIYLFGDTDTLNGNNPGQPEEDEAGALSLLYNTDKGFLALYEGIDLNQIGAVVYTNPLRTEDNSIFGSGNIVTLTAEISFTESGDIQIAGSFKDENGVTTSLASTVTATSYTGNYFGLATRARNRGVTGSDRNAPFTMDYKSFEILDSSQPANLLPAAPSALTATPGDSLVDLDWDANTESNLVSYKAYRRVASGSYATTAPQVVNHPSSEFTDNAAVVNGATYQYVVTAVNSDGKESAPSAEVSVNVPIIDVDADGMDDAWESLYFGSASVKDGTVDSNGNGVLDFFEYLYGSDPTLYSSSGFQFYVSPERNGTDLVVNWTVREGFTLGQNYRIVVSTDLIANAWDTLPVEHYSLTENIVNGKTEVELTLTHDYGTKIFLKLLQPE